MRKLVAMLSLTLIAFAFAGCSLPYASEGDLSLDILEETIQNQTMTIHVHTPYRFRSSEDLYEVALTTASLTYEKHFERFEDHAYILHFRFYASEKDYQNGVVTYGTLSFDVNRDTLNPGLSIRSNNLT